MRAFLPCVCLERKRRARTTSARRRLANRHSFVYICTLSVSAAAQTRSCDRTRCTFRSTIYRKAARKYARSRGIWLWCWGSRKRWLIANNSKRNCWVHLCESNWNGNRFWLNDNTLSNNHFFFYSNLHLLYWLHIHVDLITCTTLIHWNWTKKRTENVCNISSKLSNRSYS